MHRIPRDNSFDATLALVRDPYGFVSRGCRRHGSDLFETRLMLQKTVCMSGPGAAELFYDEGRFVRRGAMPGRIEKTLLGRGGVQGLDDEAHRHRKRMLMSLMTPESIGDLSGRAAAQWRAHAGKWAATGRRVVLYDAAREMLTRAACAWAGVPLEESEVGLRTRQLTALFDGAGSVGPRHWRSRVARGRAERWLAGFVERVRAGHLDPPEGSPAQVISYHRDPDGLPSPRVAAVELLNVLRPTVAVSVYVVFAAHALHQHPGCRRRLRAGEDGYAELFVQEVRRFYPFFPVVAARVRRDFEWEGYRFPKGRKVILSLHGTNHDARTWEAPEEFRPERFRGWDGSPFGFVPQGGGDHYLNHRCAGEWATIELVKVASRFLATRMEYDVADPDPRIDRSRLPALPRRPFVLCNVRTDA